MYHLILYLSVVTVTDSRLALVAPTTAMSWYIGTPVAVTTYATSFAVPCTPSYEAILAVMYRSSEWAQVARYLSSATTRPRPAGMARSTPIVINNS